MLCMVGRALWGLGLRALKGTAVLAVGILFEWDHRTTGTEPKVEGGYWLLVLAERCVCVCVCV